ncbi:uncharacterized protein Targ [Eurosta solidaginis]|uniref:uncharacterized protein Targ n=1 Tax=Eurosta solidaginis TaxID=178769 RepID=UPI0035310527
MAYIDCTDMNCSLRCDALSHDIRDSCLGSDLLNENSAYLRIHLYEDSPKNYNQHESNIKLRIVNFEGRQANRSPPTSSIHDVTPYYSLQSFDSSLRTIEDPRGYQSALSTTPLPSPIHRQTARQRISRTGATQSSAAVRSTSARTSGAVSSRAITDFSGQTTASLVDIAPDTSEFAAQTTSSINLPIHAKIAPNAQPIKAEFGMQTEVESSIDISAVQSTVESETLEYDIEIDPALVDRVKKLTKSKSVELPTESSFLMTTLHKRSEISDDDDALIEPASLESQARELKVIKAAESDKTTTEISSPNQNVDAQNDRRYVDPAELQAMALPPPNARRAQKSSTSLSSEPHLGSGLRDNLELGNGFLYMIIPPDGGYGWIIVLISFLCQVIVDGIVFSIGILLPYMAEDFGETQTTVVLVASVQVGCYFLAGPIASAFINKYGFRPVGLGGTLCAITVITIASFSPNLPMLIFFYSVLGGPALSLIWVTSQLIIGYYFERYRPIANGVSCSGAGAGICVFSFMNAELCPRIGWRNTSRIHTGFLVCILFMATTYIEVAPTRIATVEKDEDTSSSDDSIELFSEVRYSEFYAPRLTVPKTMNRGFEQMIETYEPEKVRKIERICPCCFRRKSTDAAGRRGSEASKPEDYDDDTVSRNTMGQKNYVLRVDPIEREDLFFTGPAVYASDEASRTASSRRTTGHRILLDESRAKSIHYSLSVARSQRQQQPRRHTLAELKNRHKFPYLAYISPKNWMPAKLFNAFAKLFDFNMLSIMEFRILLLSAFLFPMGFNIPFVYSKIRAEIDDFNRSLISPSIGFSNFVFRILSGFAANKYRAQTTYMCGGGIVFGGVATLVSAFYGEDVVWFQYTYAICYGVAPALFSTLRAIIYVRTLGLDKLTNAFGLTGLAMGFGVFVGTTIAALLNGWTHSYNAAFAFSGVCLISAGILKLILPTIIEYKIKSLALLPTPQGKKAKS